MECPNCGTYNEPGSQFCISCGQPLPGQAASGAQPAASRQQQAVSAEHNVARELLGRATMVTILSLLLLFLFRWLLANFSFVQQFRVGEEIVLTGNSLLTILVYTAALVLLLRYATSIWRYWSSAFPRLMPLTQVVAATIYALAVAALYNALVPVVVILADDPEILTALRTLAVLAAVILLAYAWIKFFRNAPIVVAQIRLNRILGPSAYIACPACDSPNPTGMSYCGHCGEPLGAEQREEAD